MISSMSQQSSDYASIGPHTPINDYYQCDHLSKPFNFLDLNNKMESTGESHTTSDMRPKISHENWYQKGIKCGHSDRSSSVSGDDTDSNGSSSKIQNNNPVNVGNCDEEKVTQEHHARRPMNAFLIFCKRHRNIVRERYSNLENRAITKILGDWWANLSEVEKSCYTNLAKEYKDAFFNANPDFKWYKLPAPPLRSAAYNRSNSGNDSSDCDTFNRTTTTTTTTSDTVAEQNPEKCSSDVATFKLADEAHMGGLNSLMVAADIVRSITNNNYKLNADQSTEDEADCHTINKNELHRVLGETGSFLQKTMNDFSDQSDVFSFDDIASTSKNIPQNQNQNQNQNKTSSSSDLDGIDDDMTGTGKTSPRACKGKRYMEFMHLQQRATIITKRIKPRTTSYSSSASLSPTQPLPASFGKRSVSINGIAHKIDFGTFDHLYANQNIPSSTIIPANLCADIEPAGLATTSDRHRADVGDFDLEQKINDLPAHNLDEYLLRKQNTKKKKKGQHDKRTTNGHRKCKKITKSKNKGTAAVASSALPKTIQEAKECLAMVGSQKRKARKESITRRDVQQLTAIVQSYTSPASNSFIIDLPDTNGTRCGASGLLMLATMAEVTANYAA